MATMSLDSQPYSCALAHPQHRILNFTSKVVKNLKKKFRFLNENGNSLLGSVFFLCSCVVSYNQINTPYISNMLVCLHKCLQK